MNSLLSFAIYMALRSPCAIQCDSPIFRRVIEFLVFRIDVINTFQLSCIVELLAFQLPNTVFLPAEISLPYLNKILAVCSRSWTLLECLFFLETVEQVQCDMRCDMNAMSDTERSG